MVPSQAKAFSFVFGLLSVLGMSLSITPFSSAMAQNRSEAFKEYAINTRQKFEKHNTKLFLFSSKKQFNSDIITLSEIDGFCFFKGGMGVSVNGPPGTIPFDLLSTASSIDEVLQLATDNNVDHMVLAILNKSYHATIYAKRKEFSVLDTCSSEIASSKHVFIGGQALLSLSVPIYVSARGSTC